MKDDTFKYLVSPETGRPLRQLAGQLSSDDGVEMFQIQSGIACLINTDHFDENKKHEMDIFNGLQIQNISYFRKILFKDVMKKITLLLGRGFRQNSKDFVIAELGGGEGHWARYTKEIIPHAMVFVCDLSMKMLGRAPGNLQRVCADITRPVFEKGMVNLASFWVSLHHLDAEERRNALKEIADALADDGLLVLFEPNSEFLPRQIMYKTRLSKDVYPDDKEHAVSFSEISSILSDLGFVELGTFFFNPPYNPDFIKKLKRWFVYLVAVETLYRIDRWFINPLLGSLFSSRQSRLKRFLSLYGFAIYQKGKV
ncbi:MAG: hypothetical protein CVU52_05860 [Deltaproteobacteria bacterium HGW-Deltaproteobacteria-10]|nr:MAG: hypothetical protein CVU52_05860 [Deltaproteobacteria bacterium HGW-Deltaproteobacteria-10]